MDGERERVMKVIALGKYNGKREVVEGEKPPSVIGNILAKKTSAAVGVDDSFDEKETYDRGFQAGRAAALSEAAIASALAKDENPLSCSGITLAELAEEIRASIASLPDQIAGIEHGIHERVVDILRPMLLELQGEIAVTRLFADLDCILSKSTNALIRIKAPAELLRLFRDPVFSHAASIKCEVSDTFEVVIDCDETRIETNLTEWCHAIGKIQEEFKS